MTYRERLKKFDSFCLQKGRQRLRQDGYLQYVKWCYKKGDD